MWNKPCKFGISVHICIVSNVIVFVSRFEKTAIKFPVKIDFVFCFGIAAKDS